MLTFKKRLTTIIFLTLFSVATIIVSCGKQGSTEGDNTEQAGEQPSDSTEHPTTDSTEHPTDSTKNQ